MNYLTVQDRKNGYVAYVHPRQGFAVSLSVPERDGDWSVECFSEYFVLERSEIKKGFKTFWFQQLYDLKEWAKVSSVYLAEVMMQFKGTPPPKSGDRYKTKSMYVVLQGKNEDQRNTLTLINPVCTTIRMSPHQLLEVVIFDHNSLATDYECLVDQIIRTNSPNLKLNQIASKAVSHIMANGQFTD